MAEARNTAETMKSNLYLTSRTCATRFSTSQVHEFQKLISSIHIYMATYRDLHHHDSDFEVKEWEICGQDLIADLCGSVDVLTPAITYLVHLQNLQVPIWKAIVWYSKVEFYLEKLSNLSIDHPLESCINLKSNIEDIKKFSFHGEKLVDGWLCTGSEIRQNEDERIELLNWQSRQLTDVENDLQQLAKDVSASLKSRLNKCLSNLQSTLTCMDIDNILNLLVGERKQNGYPSLAKESEFVNYGKENFRTFWAYVCSLPHVQELAENHWTELKLRDFYSDEVLANLKNALKVILWTPLYVEILCKWLLVIDVLDNGQVSTLLKCTDSTVRIFTILFAYHYNGLILSC